MAFSLHKMNIKFLIYCNHLFFAFLLFQEIVIVIQPNSELEPPEKCPLTSTWRLNWKWDKQMNGEQPAQPRPRPGAFPRVVWLPCPAWLSGPFWCHHVGFSFRFVYYREKRAINRGFIACNGLRLWLMLSSWLHLPEQLHKWKCNRMQLPLHWMLSWLQSQSFTSMHRISLITLVT